MLNRTISKVLFWVGIIVYSTFLTHLALQTPKPWIGDLGLLTIFAAVCYWGASKTETKNAGN